VQQYDGTVGYCFQNFRYYVAADHAENLSSVNMKINLFMDDFLSLI